MTADVADFEPSLPGLTKEARADLFGATYREQCEDEERYPFLAHWSARYGEAPARWKAWRAAGRPVPDRRELCVVGEAAIIEAFRSALAAVPDAVAWFVVRHCLVVCGGETSTGALDWLPPLPPAPMAVVRIHVADDAVGAHELGHLWTLDRPEFVARLCAARVDEVVAAAVGLTALEGDQALEEMKRQGMLREIAADRLASFWLRRAVNTTGGRRGEHRLRGMETDITRHLERAVRGSQRGGDQ